MVQVQRGQNKELGKRYPTQLGLQGSLQEKVIPFIYYTHISEIINIHVLHDGYKLSASLNHQI